MKDKIKSFQISFYTFISIITVTLIGTTIYSFFASYNLFALDIIITILLVLSIIGLIVLLSLATRSNLSELIKSIVNKNNQILVSILSVVGALLCSVISLVLYDNSAERLLPLIIPSLSYVANLLTISSLILITNNLNLDDSEIRKTNLILSILFISTFIFLFISNIERIYFITIFSSSFPLFILSLCTFLYLSIKLLKTQIINQPSRKSNLISFVLNIIGSLFIVTSLLIAIKDGDIDIYDLPLNNNLNPFFYVFIMIAIGILLIYLSNLFATDSNYQRIRRYIILCSIIATSIIASVESIKIIDNSNFFIISNIVSQGINWLLLGLYITFKPEKLSKGELATSIVATVSNLSITVCTLIAAPNIDTIHIFLVFIPIIFTIISVYNIVSITKKGKKHQDIEANPQSELQ